MWHFYLTWFSWSRNCVFNSEFWMAKRKIFLIRGILSGAKWNIFLAVIVNHRLTLSRYPPKIYSPKEQVAKSVNIEGEKSRRDDTKRCTTLSLMQGSWTNLQFGLAYFPVSLWIYLQQYPKGLLKLCPRLNSWFSNTLEPYLKSLCQQMTHFIF